MLFAASLALAVSLQPVDRCSWNKPGTNRFTGDVVSAVDHYVDIPPAIRDRLKARLAIHQYDDLVTIGRNDITGQHAYLPEITGMHFGESKVCRQVNRTGWPASKQLRGLVYCEDGYCLLVPTVCGNLSRVQRAPSDDPLDIEPAAGPGEGDAPAAAGAGPAAAPAEASFDNLEGLPATAAGDPTQVAAGNAPVIRTPYWPVGAGPLPGGWAGPIFPPVVVSPPPVVPSVPEASAWLQTLAGAGVLVAWMARRRSNYPVTPAPPATVDVDSSLMLPSCRA